MHSEQWYVSKVYPLQARDAGVSVDEIKGPVYASYVRVSELPAGATLVKSKMASAAAEAPALVCVVTREQEAAGLMYDGSQVSEERQGAAVGEWYGSTG